MSNPSVIYRAKTACKRKMQEGTVISFTTVNHPSEGFGAGPFIIGLIELQDGNRVMGQMRIPANCTLRIGQKVLPRMQLLRTNAQGLRIYDVVYELAVSQPLTVEQKLEFPGYIVALYGPSGVGKSTVSRLLTTVLGDYVENVPIVTTRRKKRGDEGEYNHTSTTEFTRMQNITEQHLLQGLSAYYGRRSILSFGLLPPGRSRRAMLSQLLHRLRSRGRDTERHIQDRMKNAERDLDFFEERSELFDHILVNEDLDVVLETLKGHVLGTEQP
ncbi:MAG: hypothetical protein UY90_C0083G0005 [Candidatus Peregrinibacteria bacterium GW2011_GWA2_54_9]|nr:MAG: hypothetical protein UY90_C0083G0005 [Candidatus Peregrinibacteria bacterium GW2011_GWA2_54_9]